MRSALADSLRSTRVTVDVDLGTAELTLRERLDLAPGDVLRLRSAAESGAEAVVRLGKIRRDGQNFPKLLDRFCKLPYVLESAHFLHARVDVASASRGHQDESEPRVESKRHTDPSVGGPILWPPSRKRKPARRV